MSPSGETQGDAVGCFVHTREWSAATAYAAAHEHRSDVMCNGVGETSTLFRAAQQVQRTKTFRESIDKLRLKALC